MPVSNSETGVYGGANVIMDPVSGASVTTTTTGADTGLDVNVLGGNVSIADGSLSSLGAKADAAATTDTGTFSLIALFKRLLQKITDGILLAAGENHIGEVGGKAVRASASFSRPADTTAYSSGDLVADNTTAGSVTPMQFTVARVAGGSGMIRRMKLRSNRTSGVSAGTVPSGGSFRVHLYMALPVPTNGDNGAWFSTQSAQYIGALDVTFDRAFSDGMVGSGVPITGSEINFALASGQILYGLLEARGAYTPVSGETFTVVLEVLQN
jgi:hypothetical protein